MGDYSYDKMQTAKQKCRNNFHSEFDGKFDKQLQEMENNTLNYNNMY